LSLDGWEPPSNRLLVALFTTATTDVRRAAYDAPATEIAGDAVDRRTGLWRRSDGIVEQAVPPPMPELRAAIGRIALEASDLDSTWRRAGALAAHLDPSLAPDVAASMVHPPVDANWIAALPDVLYRHQLAAACVLAQLRGGFSRTREVYERLVLGPVDWTSAAAIVSLGQVARRDPDDARNALGLLVLAVGDLLPHADEPRFIPLLEALHMLPCVPERVHRDRQAWYRKYLANR
jgi:hypothetical protein